MKNRVLIIITIAIATLLLMSVVYAVESGTLTFTGYVARTTILNLELSDLAIDAPRPGETLEFADTTKKGMRINVLLIEPGDTRIVTFYILNSGNMAARLGNLNTTTPDPSTGVVITWPPLDNIVVLPGQRAGPYTVTVIWDVSAQTAPAGTVYFDAYIDYTQT